MLRAPEGGTLVERWIALLARAGVGAVVLVGRGEAYEGLGIDRVDDEPAGIGPLGGLVALLRRAGARHALALACDMPFVPDSLVAKLLAAPAAAIVAPRRDGRWEPLFALYDAPRVLGLATRRVKTGDHSLQGLLGAASAAELPVAPEEAWALRDWDAPDDLVSAP
jgi:molybdopterin-guanine dinucleotide biosynthesis protein A